MQNPGLRTKKKKKKKKNVARDGRLSLKKKKGLHEMKRGGLVNLSRSGGKKGEGGGERSATIVVT